MFLEKKKKSLKNETRTPVIKSTQRIIRRVVKKIQIKDRKVKEARINVFQCRSCSYKTSEKHEISSHLHKHEGQLRF